MAVRAKGKPTEAREPTLVKKTVFQNLAQYRLRANFTSIVRSLPNLSRHFLRFRGGGFDHNVDEFIQTALKGKGDVSSFIPKGFDFRLPNTKITFSQHLRDLASDVRKQERLERNLASALHDLATGDIKHLKAIRDMTLRKLAAQAMVVAHALARKQGIDDVREVFGTEEFANYYANIGTQREMASLKRLGLRQAELVYGYKDVEQTIKNIKDVALREKYNLALEEARTAMNIPSALAVKPVKNDKVPKALLDTERQLWLLRTAREKAEKEEAERKEEEDKRRKERVAKRYKTKKTRKKKKA